MGRHKQEKESLISLVEKVLHGKELPKDKDKVLSEIKGKTGNKPYGALHTYMGKLLLEIWEGTSREDARKFFIGPFIDYLEESGRADVEAPERALILEGLYDIEQFENLKEMEEIFDSPPSEGLRITDPKMTYHKDLYYRSKMDTPLIIEGETGTSKSLMARVIHNISDRRHSPFLSINCAAIPGDFLESELFGYVKGAFTGAIKDKEGLLSSAKGGIVFLDEIGKMEQRLQFKILKAIEEKEIRKLGDTKTDKIDVRFIAAIQPAELKNIIPDLRYRLGHPDNIKMPTLRERMYPIPGRNPVLAPQVAVLALNQVKRSANFLISKDIKISDETSNALANHEYEGNYRELVNILRRAVRLALMDGRTEIVPSDLKFPNSNTPVQIRAAVGNVADVKLKDILDYGDRLKSDAVRAKVEEVFENGGDFKNLLIQEGAFTDSQYQMFMRKVGNVLGKDWRKKIKKKFSAIPLKKQSTLSEPER